MMPASIMEKRRWSRGVWSRRVAWLMPALLLLAVPRAVVLARRSQGENLHRADAACAACHTADRDTLEQDPKAACTRLAPDLEKRCIGCHDEGPSHHTGIRPRKPVPDTLPLSVDGLITCATCHFIHGEQNPYGDFLRIDNSRGGLCLTCHQLSELE